MLAMFSCTIHLKELSFTHIAYTTHYTPLNMSAYVIQIDMRHAVKAVICTFLHLLLDCRMTAEVRAGQILGFFLLQRLFLWRLSASISPFVLLLHLSTSVLFCHRLWGAWYANATTTWLWSSGITLFACASVCCGQTAVSLACHVWSEKLWQDCTMLQPACCTRLLTLWCPAVQHSMWAGRCGWVGLHKAFCLCSMAWTSPR